MDPEFLNTAQRRAQTTMTLLKNHDRHHLEQFLDGVAANEPPQYELINGKVTPPFAEVSLNESATSFDLGNVKTDDGRVVHVAYRIVKTTPRKEVSEALKYDDENPLTVPIPVAVANEHVDAWMAKYEAIARHMKAINEKRNYVFQMLKQKPQIQRGKERAEAPEAGSSSQTVTLNGAGKRPMEHVNGNSSVSKRQKTSTNRAREEKTIISRFHQASEVLFPGIVPLIEQVNKTLVTYEGVGSPFQCLHKDMQELKLKLVHLLNADTLDILAKRPSLDLPTPPETPAKKSNDIHEDQVKTGPKPNALEAYLKKQQQPVSNEEEDASGHERSATLESSPKTQSQSKGDENNAKYGTKSAARSAFLEMQRQKMEAQKPEAPSGHKLSAALEPPPTAQSQSELNESKTKYGTKSTALNSFLEKRNQEKESQMLTAPRTPPPSVKAKSDQVHKRPTPTPRPIDVSIAPTFSTAAKSGFFSSPRLTEARSVPQSSKQPPTPKSSHTPPAPKPGTISLSPVSRPVKVIKINRSTESPKFQNVEVLDLTASDSDGNEFPLGTMFRAGPGASSNVAAPPPPAPAGYAPQAQMFGPSPSRPNTNHNQNPSSTNPAPKIQPIRIEEIEKRMELQQQQQLRHHPRQEMRANPQASNFRSTAPRYAMSPPSTPTSRRTFSDIVSLTDDYSPPPAYTMSEHAYPDLWAPPRVSRPENPRTEPQSRPSTGNGHGTRRPGTG